MPEESSNLQLLEQNINIVFHMLQLDSLQYLKINLCPDAYFQWEKEKKEYEKQNQMLLLGDIENTLWYNNHSLRNSNVMACTVMFIPNNLNTNP